MADPRNNRKKRAARVLAIVLSVCMVLMLMSYIFMIFSYGTETAFVTVVYAEDLDDSKTASDRYKFLHDVLEFVHENYADKLSYDDLVNAAYKGVFDSLDPFSEYYFSSEGAGATAEALSSTYDGIGVTIQSEDGKIKIVALNPEGPAYEAGIKVNGIITAVDGLSVEEKAIDEVVSLLRGEPGTSVTISVRYNNTDEVFTLVRRELEIKSVSYEMMDDVGYIKIADMAEKTAQEFSVARVRLLAEGAKGFVIDLRDNGGGYMFQAETIAEMLLDSGTITIYSKQGKEINRVVARPDTTKKIPLVILTNEHTASAAEMLTAALHDNGAAKTVGTATYGKSLAQSVFSLVNGDSAKLTIFRFLTPNGVDFEGVGLKPDYIVYNSGTLTAEGREYASNNVIPLALDQKYFAGQNGLNVLAAQQRLFLLGYGLTPNGRMDSATVEALKDIQKKAGGKPYGGLDFFTLRALDQAYGDLVNSTGTAADAQLAKALELLK